MRPDEDLSFFETSGFSMWPFLRAGEKLVIKKTPIDDLKSGDIILYRANGQKICHRLTKKVKDGNRYLLYTRGDNYQYSSDPVSEDMYLGKAVVIIKSDNRIVPIGRKRRIINRLMVPLAPLICKWIRIVKPWRDRFLK